MLDIEFVRRHPEKVAEAARLKGLELDVEAVLALDRRRREAIGRVEALRAERNRVSREIGRLSGTEREAALARAAQLKDELARLEPELASLEREFEDLMLRLPSPPSADTPVGASSEDNVLDHAWGEPPAFDFPPRDHVELGRILDILDVERAVKFAGSRTYLLKNEGLLLELAVVRLALDLLVERGYTPFGVPVMVRDEAMVATGYFPLGREEVYRLERDELNLVGTSEVSLVASRMGETIPLSELPLRYCALSTCFRREVGSAGKDTRGLYRVHQFTKVEQVVICRADEEESRRLHAELLRNAEDVLQRLELPYRVVRVCTGDMGQGQVRKHDIETWMPSRGGYGETHSCSSFHDFQARRAGIRYTDEDGRARFCHTLNNTAVASPRILIALLEVHQMRDGSVRIPKALQPYMGGREVLRPVADLARRTD
ncbi:MAG: serine--tRNA ligase [Clostridia bacterium]|nr:serine--tRNA ligase [Clostridia bacterium]